MRLTSSRIPFWFLVAGIVWATVNAPMISFFGKDLSHNTKDFFRQLSDFASVIVITFILYFTIKKQNKRLIESEEQYRMLFELNPNPMWVYDTATRKFIEVNDSAVNIYGYDKEEFLTMTIIDIRPEEDKQRLGEFLGTINSAVSHSGTWKHLKKNGEVVYASIVTYDLSFNNKPCRLVMATNVTDLILKEDKIRAQNAALHELAWSNSHEIRRSLCSVMSLTTLLKDATSDSERNEYIKLMEQCTQDFDDILKKNNTKVDSLKEN